MSSSASEEVDFIRVVACVPAELEDAVSNYITDNICAGVEIEDADDSGLIAIKFYAQADSWPELGPAFKEYISQVTKILSIDTPEIEEQPISSVDWENAYRISVKPVVIGDDIVIHPPWVEITGRFKYDLIIEPKMAFGTGQHATTRSCLQIIHKRFEPGWTFLDFGCGTGVLSILADRLGAEFIEAVDHDETAVINCRENFEINDVKARFSIQHGSFEKNKAGALFDFVCANVNRSVIVENIDRLLLLTKENGFLLLSGLLLSDQEEIENILQNRNCRIVEFIQSDEWLTYCINK